MAAARAARSQTGPRRVTDSASAAKRAPRGFNSLPTLARFVGLQARVMPRTAMIIFTTALLLTASGIYVFRRDDMNAYGFFATFGGVIVLGIALLFLALNRMGTRANIQEYEAVRATLDTARERGGDIESAAFQLKVAEMNQWRAGAIYWRTTPFRLWWPEEVDQLEPIQ